MEGFLKLRISSPDGDGHSASITDSHGNPVWVAYDGFKIFFERGQLMAHVQVPIEELDIAANHLPAFPAYQLIGAERARQRSSNSSLGLSGEGWTEEHDDEHVNGELAIAAACYAAAPVGEIYNGDSDDLWPWDKEWDKRAKHDRIRQLVIAGALICAEIERLQRAEIKVKS